jgi:hypothetical protein
MNTEELKRHLEYLVEKYVPDIHKKSELKTLIQRDQTPPVKGVIAEVTALAGARIEEGDASLIKDIAFHYM